LETYLLILLSTVFVNNIVITKMRGLCAFADASGKIEPALGLATTFVLTLAAGTSYLVNTRLLGVELFYLRTLAFILVIAGSAPFSMMLLRTVSPRWHHLRARYLPLIVGNCVVLGIPLLDVQAQYGFVESLFFGAGGAAGFTLVLILFAALRERLDSSDVPLPFRGTSIALLTVGLMSLAFMGFTGLVK
jgi:electron transport complex protein RnfA